MTRVLLSEASEPILALVIEATDGDHRLLPPVELTEGTPELFAVVAAVGQPDVVAVDTTTTGIEPALALAATVDRHFPAITTVLFSDRPMELALAALRVGVRDILPMDVTAERVRAVFTRAAAAARARRVQDLPASSQALGTTAALDVPAAPATAAPARHGQVITLLSAKGGAGRTTVATNLALTLARTSGQPTVLVDLDLQFGDVALTLDLAPEYSLPGIVNGQGMVDSMVLKTLLTTHSSGLSVLPGSSSPEEADSVRPEQVSRLLTLLAEEFRYVVVDTAAGLGEHTLAAIEASHDLVLLAPPDVPGLRSLRTALQTLQLLGLMSPSRHLVFNGSDRRTGLTRSDVAATLELGVDVEIPRSWSVVAATNQGVPLMAGKGKEPVHRAFRTLAERFLNAPATGGRRKGRR